MRLSSLVQGRSETALVCLPALLLLACATSLPSAGKVPALPDPTAWTTVPELEMVRQQGRSDCGSAALAMLLTHFDPSTNAATVRGWFGPESAADDKTGIAAGRLRDLVRAQGLNAFVITASFADLQHELRLGRPVLVGLLRIVGDQGYPHYEVVAGINQRAQQLLLADPAAGWRKESFADFDRRWRPARNLALVVLPKPPGDRRSGHPPVARDNDHREQAD